MNSILDKVRKLLALAEGKGTTPAEAATAAAQAQRLMSKYEIDSATLNVPAEQDAPITTHHAFERKRRHAAWIIDLVCEIADTNECRVLIWPRTLQIIGRESNRQIVEYFATYLIREIDRLTRERLGTYDYDTEQLCQGKAWSNSFRLGCVYEIKQRLRAERYQARQEAVDAGLASTALVRIDQHAAKLDAWVKRQRTGTHAMRGASSADAFSAGRQVGKGIALTRGLTGAPVRRLT